MSSILVCGRLAARQKKIDIIKKLDGKLSLHFPNRQMMLDIVLKIELRSCFCYWAPIRSANMIKVDVTYLSWVVAVFRNTKVQSKSCWRRKRNPLVGFSTVFSISIVDSNWILSLSSAHNFYTYLVLLIFGSLI